MTSLSLMSKKEIDERIEYYKRKAVKRIKLLNQAQEVYADTIKAIVLLQETKRQRALNGSIRMTVKELKKLREEILNHIATGEADWTSQAIMDLDQLIEQKEKKHEF